MVRTIITPSKTEILLSIPVDYVGKPMEITYITLEELEPKQQPATMAEFWNTISDKTAKKLHENVNKMRNEWERDI